MGKGFKDVHVSFIGGHENSDKIPQWVKAHGGTFSREMNDNVTHLIASESAVKKNVYAGMPLPFAILCLSVCIISADTCDLHITVQQARDLKVNLVTYDWLEDSLLAKPPRPLKVGPYLWDRTQKSKPQKTEKPKGRSGRKPGQKNIPNQEGEVDAGTFFKKFISVL